MHPAIKYVLLLLVIVLFTGCALRSPMYNGVYGGVQAPPTLNPVDVCVRFQANQQQMLECMEFVKAENDWLREQYAQRNYSISVFQNRYSYGYGGMPGFMQSYYPAYWGTSFMGAYRGWYAGCGSLWRCRGGVSGGIYFSSPPYGAQQYNHRYAPPGSLYRQRHRR